MSPFVSTYFLIVVIPTAIIIILEIVVHQNYYYSYVVVYYRCYFDDHRFRHYYFQVVYRTFYFRIYTRYFCANCVSFCLYHYVFIDRNLISFRTLLYRCFNYPKVYYYLCFTLSYDFVFLLIHYFV